MRTLLSLQLIALVLLCGCGPSLSPLYRDYEPHASVQDSLLADIRSALHAADWSLSDSPLPNTVATQEQTLQNWGLYTIDVALEAVPMDNGQYVRLFVHPHRDFIIGGESKLAYLPPALRKDFLPELNKAFQERGLTLIGTPFERNELEQ